jgi:phytol kinase
MLQVFATISVALGVLLLVEFLQKQRIIRLETTRKTIHVVHGLSVAIWPFFVHWEIIIAVEVLFILLVALAKRYNWFESQHGIDRLSWGEFFFPIGIIAAIFLEPTRWIFVTAILHLTLADALAAMVGKGVKKPHNYMVFGNKKSLEGTLAFWVTSVLITGAALLIVEPYFPAVGYGLIIAVLPIMATLLENVGVYGSDNLLVPVFVTALLMQL